MGEDTETSRNGTATGSRVIHVGDSLTISDASRLYKLLREAVDTEPALAVDVSQVTAVDTAGVQLLFAVAQAMVNRGRPFHINGRSAALNDAVTLLGMEEALP